MRDGHVLVKICGITSIEDGRAAADAGADAVGFVFWPKSPRAVDAATARRIGEALPSSLVRVGVFVDAGRDTLLTTADEARLDVLQLHGSEEPESIAGLSRPSWKALRVDAGFAAERVFRYAGLASGIILDAAGVAPGGTGRTFDWSAAVEARPHVPFLILAGGLDPDNVASAVGLVHPDGVDVSSGVESAPGRKDHAKVREFVARVRSAS
jgi:phosphoribosylanthranilate isomerase